MNKIIKTLLFLIGVFCLPALADSNPGLLPTKPSIAALKALGLASSQYPNVLVTGYYSNGDGFTSQFYWSASSTATPSVCGPFQATGVSTGRWVSTSPVSFRGCGAKGDGTTDDSASLQAALAKTGTVKVESGRYFITTTLVPSSNTSISGSDRDSVILYDFSGATNVGCAISAADVSNFSIRHLLFQNTTAASSTQYLPICMYHPENLWIEYITTVGTGLGLVDSTGAAPFYTNTNDSNSPHNIHVNYNNIGDGTTSNTIARSGFLFSYARKWEAIGNAVSGTVFGIYWSGGDANTNGAIGNERKTYNGSVVGNYVHDTSAGAIWGSMGQGLSITGNTVINGGDVGLDDEGGLDNTWSGNTCAEMSNGCLTTFYLPVNVLFIGNTVKQSAHPLIRTYNSSLTGLSSVRFEGNILNWTGSGAGLVDDANGPVGTLVFSNNTLLNTEINFSSVNEHVMTIKNNSLTFTQNVGSAFNAINASHNDAQGGANGVLVISGNTIQSQTSQTAGSYGIATLQDDLAANPLVTISGNSIAGFPGDIRMTWTGSGAGVVMQGTVSNNIFGAGVFGRSEGGTSPSVIHLVGNTRPNGTAFPSTSDVGSNYWDVGQVFYTASPAPSGSIGSVQTAAGAPGTQKGFGTINP